MRDADVGHGHLGQGVALGRRPLVVELDNDGGQNPRHRGVGEHPGHLGELAGEHPGHLLQLAETCSASGWAKMVRIAAATISATSLGTLASTFLMTCTRQRCREAPTKTSAMASLSPRWWSEITSWTPPSPGPAGP